MMMSEQVHMYRSTSRFAKRSMFRFGWLAKWSYSVRQMAHEGLPKMSSQFKTCIHCRVAAGVFVRKHPERDQILLKYSSLQSSLASDTRKPSPLQYTNPGYTDLRAHRRTADITSDKKLQAGYAPKPTITDVSGPSFKAAMAHRAPPRVGQPTYWEHL